MVFLGTDYFHGYCLVQMTNNSHCHYLVQEIKICHCLAQRGQSSITGKELVIVL